MKTGDLVNWHSKSWVFESAKKDYANPGVVLQVISSPVSETRFVAEVYWADGKVTREYDCYLESLGESNAAG